MSKIRQKLIEVALPLEAINVASAQEKAIRRGHPSTLHLWWARRPLAACRGVLFGQLVDDPSSWPDFFPDEDAQDAERRRLFRLIEQLVQWENSTDERVVGAARLEIARSIARGRQADGLANRLDREVLKIRVSPTEPLAPSDSDAVSRFLREVAPPVFDPFAGGGSIPLEAQRLGLRAIAADLNPVAVLINKALIEVPPRFAGGPPVNPESRAQREIVERASSGAHGLAEDVRYYGAWLLGEAVKRIGHLYPPVKVTRAMATDRPDLKNHVGRELTVVAWLWARTVASPNPASRGEHVPLVSSFWLSKKPGKEAWVEPVVDRAANRWRFEVRSGRPSDVKAVETGTKTGRGDFRCILRGDPIPAEYVRREGQAGRLGCRMLAIAADSDNGRTYFSPLDEQERAASVRPPDGAPDTDLPKQALGFRVQNYGMHKHSDLFTARQLTALVTLTNLVAELRAMVVSDARKAGLPMGDGLEAGGRGALAYGDAVAAYVALAVSKSANRNCTLSTWKLTVECPGDVFTRNAISMTSDFAEANIIGGPSGSFGSMLANTVAGLLSIGHLNTTEGTAIQADAAAENPAVGLPVCVSTDPPYYDNVPYADLSDFFYVWLRGSLQASFPALFRTMLVPKATELIAEPFRHGGKERAETFFMNGMKKAIERLREVLPDEYPAAIYYAFKQSETSGEVTSSTGWETFLEAVISAGLSITGTWPVRTERVVRVRAMGSNALASSIVLVCRKRSGGAEATTRTDFRRLLRTELPAALKTLQHGNIAPVDVAQASIGPGMAIFSRYDRVLEPDGTSMTVRTALQLINQALDEYLTEQEGEFDGDTRFAITWFETRQYEVGSFGEADVLARARNVSVEGVKEAGILASGANKVRLLRRDELPEDWNPETDRRLTVWEATQHLIKRLELKGEQAAADLLAHLRGKAAPARDLAYRLYTTCERKGWAEEARSYNGLVVAWPELEKLAASATVTRTTQENLF